jgi:hypothetical protein
MRGLVCIPAPILVTTVNNCSHVSQVVAMVVLSTRTSEPKISIGRATSVNPSTNVASEYAALERYS